jgi:mannose-6-phosphate isomerase
MQPLVFEPYFRPQIWGQRRLKDRLDKALPADGPFGESWEISAHPLHVSRVAEGPWCGITLTELWEHHAEELAGSQAPATPRFPLLIKILDCHDLLSVQVHPSDQLARALLSNESGKTEAWVVLDAESTGRIYAGLSPGTTRDDLERHLDAGTVAECLHTFNPQPGDCLLLSCGTVHAAGGGILVAEVQQTSDATFRLFDWNRLGPDGKPRTLHRTEALQAIDWSIGPVRPVTPTKLDGVGCGVQGESLVHCSYFCMERYAVDGELLAPYAGQMSIWMVLAGMIQLQTNDGYQRWFRTGETVLIPASAGQASWNTGMAGSATMLAVTIP